MSKTPLPPAIRFLLITLFLNAVCFGIIVPVTPALVMELGSDSLHEATSMGGWLAFSFAAVQFFFGPVMGNLSDSWGRRPVLLISLGGFAIEFWLMALSPSLIWLFAARILSGISGASNAPAQSSIADLAAPEERGRLFGLLGAAFGIGFVIGPAIGGLLGELGPRIPFFAAATLVSFNFLYGLWRCEETLAPALRRPFEWSRANPVGAVIQALRSPGLMALAGVYFLWQLSSLIYPLMWPYFAMARWGWSSGLIGLSLVAVGLSMAMVNIFLNPRLLPRLGENRMAMLGIAGGGLAMALYSVLHNAWLAIPLTVVMAVQALAHPALTAALSRHAEARNQGELQGFASGVMALGSLVAPVIYFPVQSWFTAPDAPVQFDGAAMALAAFFAFLALLLLTRIRGAAPEREAR